MLVVFLAQFDVTSLVRHMSYYMQTGIKQQCLVLCRGNQARAVLQG